MRAWVAGQGWLAPEPPAAPAGGLGTTSGRASSRGDNRKWFYGTFSWTTSYTWAGAENWHRFAPRHSGRTYALSSVGTCRTPTRSRPTGTGTTRSTTP